jgi:predicted DNA binding CopG/RHH family protein
MKAPQLPKTDSIQELVRFWDEHDLTDFEDELEEVTESVFQRSKDGVIQIHLPPQGMAKLRRLADKIGVDYATLIQTWIREKLQTA